MAPSITSPSPSALRLLILSPTPTDIKSTPLFHPFLEAITGSKPSDDVTTFAGYTSHPPLRLQTRYYDKEVSIWCDELPPSSSAVSIDLPKRSGKSKSLPTDDVTDQDEKPPPNQPPESDPDLPPPTLSDWELQILSPEAREVRSVIGGIVLLLPFPFPLPLLSPQSIPDPSFPLLQTLHTLREQIEDESPGRDIASLVVFQGTHSSTTQKLNDTLEKSQDRCLSEGIFGWDFVGWDGRVHATTQDEQAVESNAISARARNESQETEDERRNEFGEKTGLKRALEVLEGVDWSATPNLDDEDEIDLDVDLDIDFQATDNDHSILPPSSPSLKARDATFSDPPSHQFNIDHDLQREMMELKMSMLDDHGDDAQSPPLHTQRNPTRDRAEGDEDQDSQISNLPALLERVVAIRDAGAEMSRTERERLARREVGRIMREMG